MTVKEFIEILKKENPNANILIYSPQGDSYVDLDGIQESSDKEIII